MGRALHNLKRRVKLFQKHTGKSFDPKSYDIYGHWRSWNSQTSSKSWRLLEKLQSKAKKKAAPSSDAARHDKHGKKRKKQGSLPSDDASQHDDEASIAEGGREKKWKRQKKAYIICPGSISDRFGKQPKNDNERRLLWSGALSWQWLRDSDNPSGLGEIATDEDAHMKALRYQESQLYYSSQSAERLKHFDECLGTFGLWPPCSERVQLAAKLQARGGLRKRCAQHVDKVLEPLLQEGTARGNPEIVAAARDCLRRFMAKVQKVDGSASLPQTSLPVADAGRKKRQSALKTRKVQNRRGRLKAAAAAAASQLKAEKSFWLKIFLRATLPVLEKDKKPQDAGPWSEAFRVAFYSRFCPSLDKAFLKDQCSRVVRSSSSSLPTPSMKEASAAICLLPLGVFTTLETLLLVGVATHLGEQVTVMRRSAAGPAEVVFRSHDVTHPGYD